MRSHPVSRTRHPLLRLPQAHSTRPALAHAHARRLDSGIKTTDVGGTATTSAFTDAICARLEAESHKNKKVSKGKSVAV